MKIKVFKKERSHASEKNKYFSAPFLELYLPIRKPLIKNYVLDPDVRLLKN